jgi:hypothetical protein
MQNAANREKCYQARDDYFTCVQKKGVASCGDELASYNTVCPKSWKDFFDRQQERQLVLEGQAEVARRSRMTRQQE